MSATTSPGASGANDLSSSAFALRFGHESCDASGRNMVEWKLKRNCSLAPRQLLVFYAVLCGISLAVASFFWWHGARMVMSFAWIELLAVGAAMLAYARHATDNESIALSEDRLTVELASGSRLERVEFLSQWVSVEPEAGDGSLVELSGQGRRVSVGRFVRPELRPQLASELRAALRRSALRGPAAAR